MSRKINITCTEHTEEAVQCLREIIPPDDIYLYMLFMLEQTSLLSDMIYNMDAELYTSLCLEEEEVLTFLNFVQAYQKLMNS